MIARGTQEKAQGIVNKINGNKDHEHILRQTDRNKNEDNVVDELRNTTNGMIGTVSTDNPEDKSEEQKMIFDDVLDRSIHAYIQIHMLIHTYDIYIYIYIDNDNDNDIDIDIDIDIDTDNDIDIYIHICMRNDLSSIMIEVYNIL